MESLKELYRHGHGPSSSHTMGPRKAAKEFLSANPNADHFVCDLFGSLAATGKGHFTDLAIADVFTGKAVSFNWNPDVVKPLHPNALTFKAYSSSEQLLNEETYYSVGGGKIVTQKDFSEKPIEVYPQEMSHMDNILKYCEKENKQIWEVALEYEEEEILDYMDRIWTIMVESIERGLNTEGILEGGLNLQRKAPSFLKNASTFAGHMDNAAKAISYSLAVAEENASGGRIATAPTCGSCGVLPGVLYYLQDTLNAPKIEILHALLTAGIVGNLVKYNGSISGAEVGCQGEVGTACAMASAAATYLMGGSVFQIEYAAEMGLEHHLGLTCDPMLGLVQIPCIERNAMATLRALDHATYAILSDGRHRVSFDNIIKVMMETGNALPYMYKETSKGGLASVK